MREHVVAGYPNDQSDKWLQVSPPTVGPSGKMPRLPGPNPRGGRSDDPALPRLRCLRRYVETDRQGACLDCQIQSDQRLIVGRFFLGLTRNEIRERERSEEHTSELQSLMRNSYAVFC